MGVWSEYIDSLDIPEGDRELLHRFEDMDYGSINPSLCVSERGQREAEDMMRRALRREEYMCGID